MTLRKLAQDLRVARAFSEDAGFGQRRYWAELANGYETDAGGTSLSEDSVEGGGWEAPCGHGRR